MRRVSRFPPCTPVSVARWCPRPSKASEMYFRKIRPSATCLYSAASIEPRRASAIAPVLLAMLFVVGMRIVVQDGIDYRKGLVAGVAFWVGVGFQNDVRRQASASPRLCRSITVIGNRARAARSPEAARTAALPISAFCPPLAATVARRPGGRARSSRGSWAGWHDVAIPEVLRTRMYAYM